MPDPYLKGNKAGNRPHYYCFEDTATGIYWMIPLSSRIDKFRKIIEKKEQSGKPCDILHIVKLDDSRESVFLIQDMFPITEEYIVYAYTTGCAINIGKIKAERIVFHGSILALII